MVFYKSDNAPLLHISDSHLQSSTALVMTFKRKLNQRVHVERVSLLIAPEIPANKTNCALIAF